MGSIYASFPKWHATFHFQVQAINCLHLLPYAPLSVPDREELPVFHTLFPHKLELVLGSVLSPHALSHTFFFMFLKYHGTGSC